MPSRTMNTMSEGLTSLAQMITDLKFAPDADVEWLISLETAVLQKAREMQPQPGPLPPSPMGGGAPQMPGGGGADLMSMLGGGGMPPGGSIQPGLPPAMGAPMGGPVGAPAMPPGASGLTSRPMTSADELSRVLGSGPPRGGRYGPS